MGQVTIYLDAETEEKLAQAIAASNISKSKWVAQAISERLQNTWPDSFVALAGAIPDFPTAPELRADSPADSPREPL